MNNFYSLSAELPSGKIVSMEEYRDKVILVVNTASKCGLTSQYEGLEALYKKYKDQGLEILGFPCNQFGNQEPGSADEIKNSCLINYGVSFPIFQKTEVNGENMHEIFEYLKKQNSSFFGTGIKRNFTKFLISKDGETVKRFSPIKTPRNVEEDIIKLLK